MIEAFGGRKFLAWVVQVVILLLVFVALVLTGKLTEGIFVSWLAAMCISLGIYDASNALSKKYQAESGTKPPDPAENHVG